MERFFKSDKNYRHFEVCKNKCADYFHCYFRRTNERDLIERILYFIDIVMPCPTIPGSDDLVVYLTAGKNKA